MSILTTDSSPLIDPGFPGTETSASVPNMGNDGNTPGGAGPSHGSASLSSSAGFHLPSGSTIHEQCGADQGHFGFGRSQAPLSISNTYITAIRVGSLHQQ